VIQRLLLVAFLCAGCLPAQFSLFLIQDGVEVQSSDLQYGFGNVSIGGVVNREFHLRNTGTDATLTDLSFSRTDFLFVNPPSIPQVVSGGSFIDLLVQYRPTQPGPSTASVTANDVILATMSGTGRPGVTVTLADGSTLPSPLDFGSVVRRATAARRILLSNPGGRNMLINVGTRDAVFQLQPSTSPIPLAAGGSTVIEIDFVPTTNGSQPSALLVDQQVYPLVGVGIDPPFPPPTIEIDSAALASSQQGKLTVRLSTASQASGTGEVDIDIVPKSAKANTDSGILFLTGSSRTATFNVNQGDTVGHFGSEDSIAFQTGTTAGDLVFTVKLGNFVGQQKFTIARAVVGVDSSKAQRTSAGLDLLLNAFDNTRSAAMMTFTFFDQNGTMLPPGAIAVDGSVAFLQFFGSSDLGGVFGLHAFFPVLGNPNQVDSVEVDIVNSAGTARTSRLHFTTP